jgi:hypothetical protein
MKAAVLGAAVLSATLALAAEQSSGPSTMSSGSTGSSSSGWQSRPGGATASRQDQFTQDQYGAYDRRYNWKTSDSSFDSWAKDVTGSGSSNKGGSQS